jgi:hypothetical protein
MDYIKNYEFKARGNPHWGASGIKFSKYRPSDVDGYYMHPESERLIFLESKFIKNGNTELEWSLDMRFKKMSKQLTVMVLWGIIDEEAYEQDKTTVKYIFSKMRVYNNGVVENYNNVNSDFINAKIAEWEEWSTRHGAKTHYDLAEYHASKLSKDAKRALIAQLQEGLE